MAKGKSSKSGTRDPSESLTTGLRSRSSLTPQNRNLLSTLEDLRSVTFDEWQPRTVYGTTASVGPSSPQKKSGRASQRVPYQIAFNAPADALVCVRRHRRREVLFAKKKTGKGGQRRARWSKWSNTKC